MERKGEYENIDQINTLTGSYRGKMHTLSQLVEIISARRDSYGFIRLHMGTFVDENCSTP
jgi:uncharacterized membrane protein affecting hemolysin expression